MAGLFGYFLVGPTATGKSTVAQWIAERHGYEILAADSMQVYRGIDIGTAKPDRTARARVRHHGIDLAGPEDPFSVWSYRNYAVPLLKVNAAAGRKTIVAGGTGLYVKSLTDGLDPIPKGDVSLREHWNKLFKEEGIEALQDALRNRSAAAYEQISDRKNARRLIRALEKTEAGVTGIEEGWKKSRVGAPLTGLALPLEQLKMRIESRVSEMYNAGLEEEVKKFLESGVVLSETARQAIGYAEVIDLLDGRCSREDAIARTVVRTRQLAKRQRTWFKHQLNVEWIEVTTAMDTETIAQRVLEHWRKYGPTEIAE